MTMLKKVSRTLLIVAALAASALAMAGDNPQAERQQLMKSVGKAAKPVGQMLRGDAEFDAAVLAESLNTLLDVSEKFGSKFPEGSESGEDTEAAPAIWEDREGFEQVIADWNAAISAAIAASPASLDEARPVVGPIFGECKNCHDNYRIDR